MKVQKNLSRRKFLRLAGSGATLAAVSAACTPAATVAPTAAKPAATSAPAVIAKPFAGKELTVFAGNHHDTNVRDLWIPLFQEKTGAKVTYTSIGGGDADAKYAVFLASQDGSQDVMYSWETFTAKFGRGLFEDLSAFKPALLSQLNPTPVKALTFLGKLYGIPFDSNMAIFMWNSELYEKAGLDPNKPPENWTQFADYSKKLTKDGNFGTLFTLGDPNSSFFTFISIYNSTGGSLLSDDQKKIFVDTPEGLQAMEAFYNGVVKDKWIDPAGLTINSSIEQGKVFRGGKIGHYFAFPNHYTLAQDATQSQIVGKGRTGIIPGLKLRSASSNGFEGYSMNRFSKNKELAMAWLEFTVSPEVQKLVAMKWGRPPALAATFNDAEVKSSSPQFAAVSEQVKYPAARYGSPFYFDVGTAFNDHMNTLLKGNGTPKQACEKIQADAQKAIDAYWAKVGG
ncbi:MAG: extracellular solute-binding protein [Thermoflexales bacterium]|nr:extracellular solute-binding protein [Thermoflexales bacterium]